MIRPEDTFDNDDELYGYGAAPPPPLATPVPAIARGLILYTVIGLAILGSLVWLLTKVSGGAKLLFAGQMALFTASICLIPTIAHRLTQRHGRVARILLETVLFTILLIAFGLWIFGTGGFGIWVVYAIGLILVLEVGSHLIERYMIITLRRVFRSASFSSLKSDAEAIQKMFRGELVLYVPVPIGLLIGTLVGLVGDWTPQATIIFSVQLVLSLASIVLLAFLVNAFRRMSDPLFRESSVVSTRIAEEPVRQNKGFLNNLGKVFKFLVPPRRGSKVDHEQQDLSLAYMITDLRKVYLYDSVHNAVLLVAFVSVVASVWNIPVDLKWVIVALLGVSFVFSQLPYIIGQSLLHEKVLDRYEGTKRSEMADKLKKTAPLFPTVDFLAALFATGTAGGLLYYLLDQFMKNVFK